MSHMPQDNQQWGVYLYPLGNKVDQSFKFIRAYRVVKAERVAPAGHVGTTYVPAREGRWYLNVDNKIHLPKARLLTVVRHGMWPNSVSLSIWRGHVYHSGLEREDPK